MEILRSAPESTSFIPLIEHQSSTPASFYTGPPVLHYYSDRSKLIVLEHEARSIPALAPLLEYATSASQSSNGNSTDTNGSDSHAAGSQKVIEDLDVWVTSDKLLLYSSVLKTGLSIPYPSISLHAIQSLPQPSTEQQGLYMQVISPPLDSSDDEEPESISLTIIPTASAPSQISAPIEEGEGLDKSEDEGKEKEEQTPVVAMFNALSTCSNLHPDPVEPGDEDDNEEGAGGFGQSRLFQSGLAFPGASDGGLPPAMPGSGGWITAENMHEFIDSEGNFIGGEDEEMDEDDEGGETEALGPGAGTVRTRDGDEGNGAADREEDETKWRRTG